jgi:hypothetical protein
MLKRELWLFKCIPPVMAYELESANFSWIYWLLNQNKNITWIFIVLHNKLITLIAIDRN